MLRGLFAGLAALALAACGYGSAVDMAPFSERSAFAQIRPGLYCPIDRTSGFSRIDPSENECATIEWSRATREFRLTEDPAAPPSETETFAVRRLRSGVFLMQIMSGLENDSTPYELNLALATRDAIAGVAALGDEELAQLAARHPRIRFGLDNQRPEILAGARQDIERFLLDAAALSLKLAAEEGDRPDIVVRETRRPPGQSLSDRQRRAVDAIDRLAADLAREAPNGIQASPRQELRIPGRSGTEPS